MRIQRHCIYFVAKIIRIRHEKLFTGQGQVGTHTRWIQLDSTFCFDDDDVDDDDDGNDDGDDDDLCINSTLGTRLSLKEDFESLVPRVYQFMLLLLVLFVMKMWFLCPGGGVLSIFVRRGCAVFQGIVFAHFF